MQDEREIGQILEGIANLNARYGEQEFKLEKLEDSIHKLTIDFAYQPSECLQAFEKKFVTKEQLKPIEETCGLIKRASIYFFCSVISLAGAIIAYMKGLA